MENKELGTLWALFRAHDADKSGEIDIDEFYNMIGEKRSIFGDSIFELIDISNDGTCTFLLSLLALRTSAYVSSRLPDDSTVDFSEFVQTLGTVRHYLANCSMFIECVLFFRVHSTPLRPLF